MNKILVIKPSFDDGNVGDNALIKTVLNLFKSYEIYIPKSKNELNKLNNNLFDFLIYIGTDCIPYYIGCIPIEKIKQFLLLKKKVHIINTSWGKNPKSINIIKSIANDQNFHIYMRDKYSHELIQKDITFYNIPILTADLAFLCKKNDNNKIEELEDWINKNNTPIIGINTHYDFKEYNNNVRIEIQKFIINNKNKYKFLFIPHDSRKQEYEDLKKLQYSCGNIDGYTVTYLDPEYEKFITSRLYLVITGRMHLSILTIPNNIPSIAISYNGLKSIGTFSHWDLDNLVIEPQNIQKLSNLVEYIENNYKMIQDKINNKKEYVKELVNKQILI